MTILKITGSNAEINNRQFLAASFPPTDKYISHINKLLN